MTMFRVQLVSHTTCSAVFTIDAGDAEDAIAMAREEAERDPGCFRPTYEATGEVEVDSCEEC